MPPFWYNKVLYRVVTKPYKSKLDGERDGYEMVSCMKGKQQ